MLKMLVRTWTPPGKCPEAYCECWNGKSTISVPWAELDFCNCGEDNDVSEWNWEEPPPTTTTSVALSDNRKQVTFHPHYSSGTAAVKGDTALQLNYHYYWEVKMLTDTYGTDIMVGVGTEKVNIMGSLFKFTSLLGEDAESYGMSYRGTVHHEKQAAADCAGFCKGTIVGVRVDLWRGTLEFFINRKPQGVAFYNLRRHSSLYPMMCSTAAQSTLRLIYAASWKASLLVDAAKVLAASVNDSTCKLPPGLVNTFKSQYWMTIPNTGFITGENDGEVSGAVFTTSTVGSNKRARDTSATCRQYLQRAVKRKQTDSEVE